MTSLLTPAETSERLRADCTRIAPECRGGTVAPRKGSEVNMSAEPGRRRRLRAALNVLWEW